MLDRPPNADAYRVQTSTDYYKIVITFKDKVRTSNVFTYRGGAGDYTVQVEKDSLIVRERESPLVILLSLCCFSGIGSITILVEVIVSAIYRKIAGLNANISLFLLVVLANLLSLPIVYLVLPKSNK